MNRDAKDCILYACLGVVAGLVVAALFLLAVAAIHWGLS